VHGQPSAAVSTDQHDVADDPDTLRLAAETATVLWRRPAAPARWPSRGTAPRGSCGAPVRPPIEGTTATDPPRPCRGRAATAAGDGDKQQRAQARGPGVGTADEHQGNESRGRPHQAFTEHAQVCVQLRRGVHEAATAAERVDERRVVDREMLLKVTQATVVGVADHHRPPGSLAAAQVSSTGQAASGRSRRPARPRQGLFSANCERAQATACGAGASRVIVSMG
jgi:hypothetical protein